jgi:hypothetical protein
MQEEYLRLLNRENNGNQANLINILTPLFIQKVDVEVEYLHNFRLLRQHFTTLLGSLLHQTLMVLVVG